MKLGGTFAGRRTPAIGKAFYVRELRGQLLACKWPVRRKGPLHPTTVEQNIKFAQANKMTQFVPAAIQVAHRKMVEGTKLLPRDLMISSMYGRGFQFIIAGQVRRYPVAARQDLSLTLDILGALAGDVLARGPELWERVRPNVVGEVLTSQGPGLLPLFQTPPTGAGGWVTLNDYTIPTDLALQEKVLIAVPANFIQLEVDIIAPATSGGVRFRGGISGNAGSDFRSRFIETYGSTAIRGQTWPALGNWVYQHTSGTPANANQRLTINYNQQPITLKAFVNWTYFLSNNIGGSGSGMYTNPNVNPITELRFISDEGNGLRAGTRFITRGVLP